MQTVAPHVCCFQSLDAVIPKDPVFRLICYFFNFYISLYYLMLSDLLNLIPYCRMVRNNFYLYFQNCLRATCGTDRDIICSDRNFRPAFPIADEIIRCLDDSAVFIAIMSLNYCQRDFCKFEIQRAFQMEKPIILIFIEEVPENEMTLVIREVFRNYTRVKFVSEDGINYRLEPNWEQVCKAVVELS